MVGIAHSQESIDCAVLVATDRVDDGMPGGESEYFFVCRANKGNYDCSQDSGIKVGKDGVKRRDLGIRKLVYCGGPLWEGWRGSIQILRLLPLLPVSRRC